MNTIIRASLTIVLLRWAYLSYFVDFQGPLQTQFSIFLCFIAGILIYPVLKELNGQFFPKKENPKSKKFRPHAIY